MSNKRFSNSGINSSSKVSSVDGIAPPTVEYLVVAGGGGGGGRSGGGGGAGGFKTATGLAVVAGTTYTVTVGLFVIPLKL